MRVSELISELQSLTLQHKDCDDLIVKLKLELASYVDKQISITSRIDEIKAHFIDIEKSNLIQKEASANKYELKIDIPNFLELKSHLSKIEEVLRNGDGKLLTAREIVDTIIYNYEKHNKHIDVVKTYATLSSILSGKAKENKVFYRIQNKGEDFKYGLLEWKTNDKGSSGPDEASKAQNKDIVNSNKIGMVS